MSAGCEICSGTGFEYVTRDGHVYAQPCACRAPTRQADPASFLRACRIPARYEECSFANFEPGHSPSLSAALQKCLRFCNGYPYLGPTTEGLGLLFTGSTGVGKTHLAVSVLRELVGRKGARGQFWDFHSLIREIRNCYNPETRTTELQVLEPVVETDVLLLDDLGAWRMTDWMVDTLFYVLNNRYLAKRATIVTTNLQDEAAETARKDDGLRRKEYLVERIGQPLRSRLMEMCLVVDINADDYRQVRQTSNRENVLGSAVRGQSG